ncbi:uncharacterized protein LOC103308527 [Acyrthosiphon pisum]|uniref:DDE Tnp4 domain-containing protein n=1 Tax=Acyrthosiphon pisum TaxID=7029 RepID=A0A8R1X1L3_ACYPI|nr:uncharacterized protein LOC103308527 [Acyrthosiphon pisum]|eukprot:XP_008180263.1 PREDICTED: uncharacterized protein LOC103308527 [Acyrthosiphon pisum]
MSLQIAAAAYIYIHLAMKKKSKRRRRWWTTHLYTRREETGGNTLLQDLRIQEINGQFQNFMRMTSTDFDFLINLIGPKIVKSETILREPISVQERLAVTLRFLVTGESFTSLQYLFRMSKQVISNIVPEVCEAIIDVLKDNIQVPNTPEKWLGIANDFETKWNFPHTLGSMDGKHVVIQAPINTGSEYFNYKSSFSIVLFAVVDANYNFIFVDAGCQGRISDGGVFQDCQLNKKLKSNSLGLPLLAPLPGRRKEIPFFFIGDGAFPLTDNIMKPFSGLFSKGTPERIYNYRLSRARRVVENVFGIISSVFRVLRKPLLLNPEKSELIIMTIAHLHNFLRRNNTSAAVYTPNGIFDSEVNGNFIEGTWRETNNEEISSLRPIKRVPRKSTTNAMQIREEIMQYCINEGNVIWQEKYA